jgi:hypothetical protein
MKQQLSLADQYVDRVRQEKARAASQATVGGPVAL